ncbi:MAG: hypothetical protein U0941_30310 [Planctomycetaceae bacterium]
MSRKTPVQTRHGIANRTNLLANLDQELLGNPVEKICVMIPVKDVIHARRS